MSWVRLLKRYLFYYITIPGECKCETAGRMPEKHSSEDFSQYLTKKPGVFFRLGTRNAKKGCTTLPHNNDFMIDEEAFVFGTDTCVQFVMDYMNGIDSEKIEESVMN